MRLSASRRSRTVTDALVAGQVALALLVLSAAALVSRTLIALERADLQLEPTHVLIASLTVRTDRFETKEKQFVLLDRLMTQLTALPGVVSASPVNTAPYDGGWVGVPAAEGQTKDDQARNTMLAIELVAPDYFKSLGVPVLRGRAFAAEDREGAPGVVMLSETAVRQYFPGSDGVGKRLAFEAGKGPWVTVIGVVPETRYRDLRDPRPTIYFPLAQSTFPFAPTTLAIRTSGQPAELIPAIRRAIAAVDPEVALASASPFEALMDQPLAQPRLNALLLGVFALAAVALASIGLFGAMATMVRQRTRELGVRLALGATSADLGRMVVRRGATIAAVGLALGLAGALLSNRALSALLYQVSPTDGLTLTVVSIGLLAVALLACLVPARASTRVDPVIALRSEG